MLPRSLMQVIRLPCSCYLDHLKNVVVQKIKQPVQSWVSFMEPSVSIQEAAIFVVQPPSVRGMGRGGGFKMIVQDKSGLGLSALEAATWQLAGAANQNPKLTQVFSTIDSTTPQYYLDIDRTRAEMLNVPVKNVFETLQVYLGSSYVNDFNLFGKTYQVIAQADAPYRLEPEDIMRLRAKNSHGEMVPLGSILKVLQVQGANRIVRYNLYPSAELQGSGVPGVSTGEALIEMEKLADDILPPGISFEWTEIALQEKLGGNVGIIIFPLSVLFVFCCYLPNTKAGHYPLPLY